MNEQTILVVGGAGYIGAHMAQDLLRAGYRTVVLDNLSRGHRDLVPAGCEFIKGDIGDRELLNKVFTQHPISAVMHFAAFSLVGESVQQPLAYYRNNLARTADLVEAMLHHRIKRFIFSSTAAVYGEPESTPITEKHPCRPTNPYGASKLAVERMLRDCATAHDLKYISLRYFNAAGADASGNLGERHDPETHLIPLVMQAAAGVRENICIFGSDYPTRDGTCIRDYIHVSDLTQAHILALESLLEGGGSAVFNLGNNNGYSVREVIKLAREVTGRDIPVINADRRAGDPAVLIADSSRIRAELGWRPHYEDLRTILETAWRWHQREVQQKPGQALP